MKFLNYVKYNRGLADTVRARHRQYAATLMAAGKLVTAGPLNGAEGGLFIYEMSSLEEAQQAFDQDPYRIEGAVEGNELSVWEMIGVNLRSFL